MSFRVIRGLGALVAGVLVAASCGAGSGSPSAVPERSPVSSISASAPPSPAESPGPSPPVSAPPAALAWRQLSVEGDGPGAREDHTWTADPTTGAVYLFGGRAGGTAFDDLWRLDPAATAWERIEPDGPAPAARFGHTGTWVPGHGLVVWSGQAGSSFFADLWAYDPAANRWTELPAGGDVPPARYGSCAALGPDGRLWVSHGFTQDAGRFSDTVAYDFEDGRWADETGDGPVIRCLHDCLFTPSGNLVIYAGQTTGAPAIGDLWARPVDGAWSQGATGGEVPPPRQLYGLASAGQSAFVFGGAGADGEKLGDLWRLDLTTLAWERLEPTGSPPARSGSAMVHDAARDRILLFGGTDGSTPFADLWELAPAG